MSVLSCSRRRCDEIMCRTYIPSTGYICLECQEEFKNYLDRENIPVYSNHDIHSALGLFMDTEKGFYLRKQDEVDIDSFFQGYTQDF